MKINRDRFKRIVLGWCPLQYQALPDSHYQLTLNKQKAGNLIFTALIIGSIFFVLTMLPIVGDSPDFQAQFVQNRILFVGLLVVTAIAFYIEMKRRREAKRIAQTPIIINLICDPSTYEDIEKALKKEMIKFAGEENKALPESHRISIPNTVGTLTVTLHIFEARKEFLKGNIAIPGRMKFELTQDGIKQLKEYLRKVNRPMEDPLPAPSYILNPLIINDWYRSVVEEESSSEH